MEASFFMYLIVFIIWHTCVYLEYEHKCSCLWRTEEGIRANATAINYKGLQATQYWIQQKQYTCSMLNFVSVTPVEVFSFLIVLASIGSVG